MSSENDFIISAMKWSFSRLEQYYSCPYAWKRTYIDCEPGIDNAFAQYGHLVHEILEEYNKGQLDFFSLLQEYESRFAENITRDFPPNKYADLRESYYKKGYDYFENFSPDFDQYEILGVEKLVEFVICDKPFIGYIDLLLKDQDDKIIVLDHKSANITFLKNGSVSKGCSEKMKMYKRQLYMYSKAIIDAGMKVDYLEWNFFNNRQKYRIPFKMDEYHEAIQWTTDTIKQIEKEEYWFPSPDYYKCHYICDHRDFCEYKPNP